jgi:hypothetical protein
VNDARADEVSAEYDHDPYVSLRSEGAEFVQIPVPNRALDGSCEDLLKLIHDDHRRSVNGGQRGAGCEHPLWSPCECGQDPVGKSDDLPAPEGPTTATNGVSTRRAHNDATRSSRPWKSGASASS